MSCTSRRFKRAVAALALAGALGGCRHLSPWADASLAPVETGAVSADASRGWGQTIVVAAEHVIEESGEGPYWLDSGDRLRIFVYGHPNLSRLYTVDQQGMVAVPLIGDVPARGRTTRSLARTIAARLGARYVRDPQVTVDIAQNRPFFILGEVRNAGQFPFVSGMTVQAAVAIAGGYADRADERRIQITRRHPNGIIEKMDVPPDYPVRPGDTLYVYERWL
jgi:polysaccharide export outer membrane protein